MCLTDQELASCLTNRVLQLIVMPTEGCNFRCSYCWERFVGGKMQDWVVAAIKKLLRRRADGLEWLRLDWFGGEPLLAVDIVEDVQKSAQSLASDRPGLGLLSSMTTNGYLLDLERFIHLVTLGVTKYVIALDGPPETHDTRRVTAGGRGTFDRIWTNLIAARSIEKDFRVVVRLQIGDEGLRVVQDFLQMYATEFGSDDRFRLAVVPLSDLGSRSSLRTDLSDSLNIALAARTMTGRMNLAVCVPTEGTAICHASRANAVIVRPDGSLSKCPVALYHRHNSVGRLLNDGRVEVDTDMIGGWMRGLRSGDESELRCPKKGWADDPKIHNT